ncbi:hypothetical protein Tco_0654633 [Tanacetum coccineum]|uniref:Uncharacterized protein n=1 Tax=Tanacetum coccineum TaxID=301880 RepID=A0ABQ4X3R7_9ASTR
MYRTVKIIMISNECHVTIVLSCFYITQIVRLEGDGPPSKPSVVPCGRKIYERETSLESLNPSDVFALHKARIEFLYRRRVVEKEVRCRRRVVEEEGGGGGGVFDGSEWYLRNTDMVPVYRGNLENELRVTCYTDGLFETDKDDRKSQLGYVFILNEGAID